ncbi:GAF domain-containing protein [Nocardia jiangxiensis]|uniref:GAF domain-containing protein n=1 Tax=Nocardia jiangxiensis TaxID=282685 RepID=UPI0003057B6D|nr:GAF domain-containing protein [Nocardia jiangxiensis]
MQTANPKPTPWTMIETLDPAASPTVVSSGDSTREFTSTHRVLERAINNAQLGTYVTADDLYRHIIAVRDRSEPIDWPIRKDKHHCIFRALPVLGPNEQVHGVRFWLGPADLEPPEPRRATGVVWDLASRMVRLTPDCTRMAGISDAIFVPEVPLATFWRYASRFDDHEAVFNLLYRPKEHARLQTMGTVRHADNREMLWQATIRTRHDSHTIGAWGLLEDLTSDTSRPPTATLEQQGLREYLRSAGTYLGVVHIPDGTIVHWLSDPPPWFDCTRSPDELFPPEDHARLTTAVAPDEGVVRVLNPDSGYTPTKIVLSPYRGCRNNRLAIGQFFRVDDNRGPRPRQGCTGVHHGRRAHTKPSLDVDPNVREQPPAEHDTPGPPSAGHERLHTLAEVPRILRVSRTTVFELLASGALPSIRIGSRRFVTDSQIDDYLSSLKRQQ